MRTSEKVALGEGMTNPEDWGPSAHNPVFFGREREMEWLFDRFRGRRAPIIISGPPGVGKTALLNQFLASAEVRQPPLVMTARFGAVEAMVEIGARIDELYRERHPPEIVAIDEAEALDERQLNVIASRVLNLKAIRMLILVTRRLPDMTSGDVLQLQPLSPTDAQNMLRSLLGADLPADDIISAALAAAGLPFALRLLAELARGHDLEEIRRLFRGEVYDLNQQLILPKRKILADVRPRIILANESLVERLRRQPSSIYELPPRKFEELIAELLTDLGYEVELTPATRDGGKDILAYMTTPHGKLLCLVEAKKYRRDRHVGVELVRQLYGTLIDADASSAMLVTTSSFSSGAKAFEQRHQYKLALRDYGSVIQWIEEYGKT